MHRPEHGCFAHRAEVLELASEPEGLLEVCGILGAAPLAGATRRLPDEPVYVFFLIRRCAFPLGHEFEQGHDKHVTGLC